VVKRSVPPSIPALTASSTFAVFTVLAALYLQEWRGAAPAATGLALLATEFLLTSR
jgi:hypothetical protein